MPASPRRKTSIPSDLRGASRLATDATLQATRLVETMHHNIARTPGVLGRPTLAPTRGITGLVYRSVRGLTRLVGSSVDASLAALEPLLGAGSSWAGRDTVLAVLNGVLGDHLESSGNPLAIEMQLRHDGVPLELTPQGLAGALPGATGKVAVLVHGLCMGDRQWTRKGHDHGQALARDLGYTPVYVRYNSGLHVSSNGRRLASLLEALTSSWPLPIEDLAIIGHSMGGLVARSAVHYGRRGRRRWPGQLRRMIFIAAAPGSTCCSAPAPTRSPSPSWAACAAPASPTCATAACSTTTGRVPIASRWPRTGGTSCRCPAAWPVMRLPVWPASRPPAPERG
jgi:pimeloyl-ACP methyl ester carboxylesterase